MSQKGLAVNVEAIVEKMIYRSRWVLVPIYLGLTLAVVALTIKFFQELWHLLSHILSFSEADMILVVLSLIDITMVGGLLVMVMMSGYENFVSKLDVSPNEEKLSWLGTMDTSSLKAKIAASIVAISSIHLLKMFMNAQNVSTDHLKWYVIIHLTFVSSAFAMGYLDTLTKSKKKPEASLPENY